MRQRRLALLMGCLPVLASSAPALAFAMHQPSVAPTKPPRTTTSRDQTDDQAAAEFDRQLRLFCEVQDGNSQRQCAQRLQPYIPGKSAYGHIWRTRSEAAPPRMIKSLISLAASDDFIVRHTAVESISLCGDTAVGALPDLMRMARGADESMRFSAQEALERLSGTSKRIRTRLIDITLENDLPARLVAVEALRQWNWKDADASSHLVRLIKESDDATAQAAVRSLSPTKEEWKTIVPAILDQAEGPRAHRGGFIAALPEMEEAINPSIPRIVKLLGDKSVEVRVKTCETIARLARYSSVTHDFRSARLPLERLKNDAEQDVRAAALAALGVMDTHQK